MQTETHDTACNSEWPRGGDRDRASWFTLRVFSFFRETRSRASKNLFLADSLASQVRISAEFQEEWQLARPYVSDPERILIVKLDATAEQECQDLQDKCQRALQWPSENRVRCTDSGELTPVMLSEADVVLVLGHSSDSEADVIGRMVMELTWNSRHFNLAFVLFGTCDCKKAGQLIADAGIPTLCFHGTPLASQIEHFDREFCHSILAGSNVNEAFDEARICWQDTSSGPCLLLPTSLGSLRHWARKWQRVLGTLLLVLAAGFMFLKIWRQHLIPKVYASAEFQQCSGATRLDLSPITPGLTQSTLQMDFTCHDPRVVQTWMGPSFESPSFSRLDTYSKANVQPTFLLVTHTVISASEAVQAFKANGIGAHFIINRDGYVLQQVLARHKAYATRLSIALS